MTDLTTLKALRERVRGATGRLDDETLGRLICAANGVPFGNVDIQCGDDGSDEFNVWNGKYTFWYSCARNHAPDASLDAAVALVERLLPGCRWSISTRGTGPYGGRVAYGDGNWFEEHKTAPLALLSAILTALISQAEEKERADV